MNNQEMNQDEMSFKKIWKEMEKIEPLTPLTDNEESEFPRTSTDIYSSTP